MRSVICMDCSLVPRPSSPTSLFATPGRPGNEATWIEHYIIYSSNFRDNSQSGMGQWQHGTVPVIRGYE